MILAFRPIFPFLAGLIASLGNAPASLPLITLVGAGIAVYFSFRETKFKSTFRVGFLFGAGYFVLTLSWLIYPFLVDPDETRWMAPFAPLLTALGLSLFWGLAFGMPTLLTENSRDRMLVLLIGWIALELLREHLFTGFPWGMFAYTLDRTPIMQVTSLIGANGLTALLIGLVIVPFLGKHLWHGVAASVGLLALVWTWGSYRIPPEIEFKRSDETIRIIQPNIPQSEKWDPMLQSANINLLLELSNRPSENEIDLLIWPETAITVFVNEEDMALISLKVKNIPFVAGFRRLAANRMYNSLLALDDQGELEQIYDKQHLVPFGEFIPFEGMLKWIQGSGLANDEIWDFSEGSGSKFLNLPVLGKARALICYEAIFPNEVRTGERPDSLLQITNDAWIGNSWGPRQHFAIAKARATELGLPLIRVSNNGISAVTDGYGQPIQMLDVGVRGVLDANIPITLPPTFYSKVGDWPLVIVLFLSAMFLLIRSKTITNIH